MHGAHYASCLRADISWLVLLLILCVCALPVTSYSCREGLTLCTNRDSLGLCCPTPGPTGPFSHYQFSDVQCRGSQCAVYQCVPLGACGWGSIAAEAAVDDDDGGDVLSNGSSISSGRVWAAVGIASLVLVLTTVAIISVFVVELDRYLCIPVRGSRCASLAAAGAAPSSPPVAVVSGASWPPLFWRKHACTLLAHRMALLWMGVLWILSLAAISADQYVVTGAGVIGAFVVRSNDGTSLIDCSGLSDLAATVCNSEQAFSILAFLLFLIHLLMVGASVGMVYRSMRAGLPCPPTRLTMNFFRLLRASFYCSLGGVMVYAIGVYSLFAFVGSNLALGATWNLHLSIFFLTIPVLLHWTYVIQHTPTAAGNIAAASVTEPVAVVTPAVRPTVPACTSTVALQNDDAVSMAAVTVGIADHAMPEASVQHMASPSNLGAGHVNVPLFCGDCGVALSGPALFCEHCGNSLEMSTVEPRK